MRLPDQIRDAMVAHARFCYPEEACGLLAFDDDGRLYLCAKGRRVITTRNAYMQMPSPLERPGSKGQWAEFVRIYSGDLSGLRYSSIMKGPWDWT